MKTAIIAAMEREVALLVRGWKKSILSPGGKTFVAFERGNVLVVVSGIGCRNAALAARAAVDQFHPSTLMSVGLAGALIRSLKVGSVFTPSVVVDAADEVEYRCSTVSGHVAGGILVSASGIAGAEAKKELVNRFHGLVVDMEAAGVAQIAQQEHLGFRCVKAISDEADFIMPPMARFIDAAGRFQSGWFAGWSLARPWHWARVAALGRNSGRAKRALCKWLEKALASELQPEGIVTLNAAELSEAKR
jgi:adenosylhomocysteine nucleosidase